MKKVAAEKTSWLPNYYVALVNIQRLANEDKNEFVAFESTKALDIEMDKILTMQNYWLMQAMIPG
jgi:hypothetical protein